MATEKGHPQHGSEGYEHKDANVPSLVRFGVILAILIVAVMLLMVPTWNFISKLEPEGPPASPFVSERPLPPQPRLQAHPATDLKRYCEMEEHELATYGWVDQHNGLVRIPVNRAMDMVLQKGLPARPASQAPAETVITPVGSAAEPRAIGVAGPCGYLAQPPVESAESK